MLRKTFVILLSMLISNFAFAVSCIVVGEKTAKVQSSKGEKFPVFLADDCDSLRAISGTAMVSWVSREGKVNFAPISVNGPERHPLVGSEDRSGKVVWAELTSTRETRRPAFMRSFGDEKAVSVYLPEAGILIKPKIGERLKIISIKEGVETLVVDSPEAMPFLVARELLKLGTTYQLEWTKGGNVEREKWKFLDGEETMRLDTQFKEIQESGLDQDQLKIVTAMLFEQLKLVTNMRLLLLTDLQN